MSAQTPDHGWLKSLKVQAQAVSILVNATR